MSADQILTIDQGTQSARVMVFDLRGNLIARSRVPIVPYVSPEPGLAEQDPEVFWQAICLACQQLWKMDDVDPSRIAGVALTTQRSTVINLDKNGRPLRPAIVWLDQRRTEGLKPIQGVWSALFTMTGMNETISYLQAEAEANWIRTYQPEIWKNTHKYLFLSGYLTWKLTNRFADSIGCQVGYVPFDYRRFTWEEKWDWKWQAVPIEERKLPELEPPTGLLGKITPQASEETGIPVGLPLIAAAADKACEVIGAGCLDPHTGCLSYGSSATINTTNTKYVEVVPLLPPYPSAVPGAYSLEVQIYRGFWMISWFKEQFGFPEKQLAGELGIEAEKLLDELVEGVPPGSQGLILQPYWSPGLRTPGPEAKGAVIGFGDVHTRAHLYRAILEGLAYALREGSERIVRRSGIPILDLRVAGGGSQSRAAMQITADIFGLPVSRPHVYEASGLGAAIDAAVGLHLHPDFTTAVREMTHLGTTFEPNPEAHYIYNELYHRVYCRLYDQLKSFYYAIREITNYPSQG